MDKLLSERQVAENFVKCLKLVVCVGLVLGHDVLNEIVDVFHGGFPSFSY